MPTTQFRRSSRVAAQPAAPFRCWRSRAKTATMVTVTGELDIATVPDLDTQLRAAERDTPLVVLDLRALEFVDSSGAALMLATDRRVSHAGGRFVVVRGPVEVQWLLALTGFDRELELVDQPSCALGALAVRRGVTRARNSSGVACDDT